jgi:AAA+ ATPase superfamily predicted ATPase
MSLFSLNPKESPSQLFGREQEIDEFTRLVQAGRWVAMLGPRMVGKTSLIKASNMKLEKAGIRAIYVNLWGTKGTQGLLGAMAEAINNERTLVQKIEETAQEIEEISFGPSGISVSISKKPMTTMRDLLASIGRQNRRIVIELDEIQELSAISGHLLKLLAYIFNTYSNLVFVFTGSMFGLTKTLLEPSSTSPLYGRSPARLILRPFGTETAKEFLRKGLQECNVKVDEKAIAEAIELLDGIPGWLTFYGNNATLRSLPHEKALEETVSEAGKIVIDEIEHFLKGRDRTLYIAALKVAAISARWKEVKNAVQTAKGSATNDSTISNTLENLKAAMLVEEKDGVYLVIDPMLRRLLLTSEIS